MWLCAVCGWEKGRRVVAEKKPADVEGVGKRRAKGGFAGKGTDWGGTG